MRLKLENVLILFYICVLVDDVSGQEVTTPTSIMDEVFINDENNYNWSSTNFPQPYPQENKTLIVKVEFGYTISVIITDLDLNSENGDFLVIKAGTTLNDKNTGKVFIHNLKSVKKYIIDSVSIIMSFRVLKINEAKKKGFFLFYKREGVVVTTVTPVVEVTWPTPSATDHIYFTGNVSGRNQNDFENETALNEIKTAIALMATEYCAVQNIHVRENITELNVHINKLISCPYEWPKSSTCVKVRFSVPIFLYEKPNTTNYELSSDNLKKMWNQLANKFLNQISLSVYEEPNAISNLSLWLVIICVIIIVFIGTLLLVKILSRHISPLKPIKRRNSDTQSIVKSSMRASNLSLSPHPLQEFPPFCDIDSTYFRFEPDIRETTKQCDYPSDDEDEIIIGKFNNMHHNITDNSKTESSK